MDEAARWATVEDQPEIELLRTAAIDEARPKRGGTVLVAEPRMTAAPGEHDLYAFGTIDSVPVGYLRLVTATLEDGLRIGVLSELFVLVEARGVGVGETMIDLVLERVGALELDALESVALPGDRNTKNFFETHGLVARAITVHRSLRP